MADDGLRFEAWTMPHVGTFTKKFDFTKWVDSYTINDRFNDLSDGTLTLSDDFPKKDQIFFIDEANHANDVGSTIRVLRGTTPIAHYLVTRSEDAWSDGEPTHKLTLEGLEWILDRATVPHYDFPANPTVEPDWIYGADTLLANAFLEGSPQSLELQFFHHTQTSGTFTITYSGQTTSALAFNASWFDVHQALEALSNIQDVVVTGDGTPASPFEIEFLDPSGNVALITTTATGNAIWAQTEGGVQDPAGWTKSFHPQTGEQHGQYFNFDVSSTQNHTTAGTYSLRVVADVNTYPTDYPGVQQIQNVTGGRTYRAEMWVYPTTTMDFRLIVRTMDETAIDGAMVEATLTANSWQKLTIPPFEVPEHISQVIVRLGLLETGGGTFFVDDGVFAPGFPAAALGFIMNDLRTAMIAQGTLGWITPTWTTTTDTDGAAWDQDLKWLVNHDQTLLQLFEYMRQWNYEWRIRWDVADARFEWDMWNPLGGGQTRANIAITGKSGVTQGNPIVKRPPGATYVRVEGELGRWGENASTTLDDVWGRLEKAVNDRQGVDSLQLDTFATRLVVREGTDTAGRAVTVEDPTILPWQAYEPGDTVTLNLAPKDTKQALRVVALVASMSPGQATPRYDVHFVSPILSNEAAMAQGLRTLWRKFNNFRPNSPAAKIEPPAPVGGGSAPTIFIAASNATPESKAKADFICTGTNDRTTFIKAHTILDETGAGHIRGGRILLSEGTFFVDVTAGNEAFLFEPAAGGILQGLGRGATTIEINAVTGGAPMGIGLGTECVLRDLSILVNAATDIPAVVVGFSRVTVENVYIIGNNGEGIKFIGAPDECSILNTWIQSGGHGIDIDGGFGHRIQGNSILTFTDGAGINMAAAINPLITGNYFPSTMGAGIFSTGVTRPHIADNHLFDTNVGEIHDACILIDGTGATIPARGGIISDNEIDATLKAGIVIRDGYSHMVVTGNKVTRNREHGIHLADTSQCLVQGNVVSPLGNIATDNTFDNIILSGNSDKNNVQGNTVVAEVPHSGINSRYGINVSASTCNDNVVNDNYAYPVADFQGGAYNDAGTATQGANFSV